MKFSLIPLLIAFLLCVRYQAIILKKSNLGIEQHVLDDEKSEDENNKEIEKEAKEFEEFLNKFSNSDNKEIEAIKVGLLKRRDHIKKRKEYRKHGNRTKAVITGDLASKKKKLEEEIAKEDDVEDGMRELQQLTTIFKHYQTYKKEQGKSYNGNTVLNWKKFANYINTQEKIDNINSNEAITFTLKANKFSDMSKEEYESFVSASIDLDFSKINPSHIKKPTRKEEISLTNTNGSLGADIDWVKAGKISPIKDQESCGSCWAFAAVAVLEAFYAIKKNVTPISFSPQEHLDCVKNEVRPGTCLGGHAYHALQWFGERNYKCSTWEAYPYVQKTETCKTLSNLIDMTGLYSTIGIRETVTQQELYNYLKNGPVVISMDAKADEFENYESGVLRYQCTNPQAGHAMLLVGYGKDQETGKNFWLIKNSWGTKWGLSGYGKIEQSSDWNACLLYEKIIVLE